MKLEEILAPCPKCGSTDKTAKRRIIDVNHGHAELDTVKCDNCGYVFLVNEPDDEDLKKNIIKELNKIY